MLWTPEVRSSKTAEEWLRRMQSVCFSPMAMINAWADGTKPWSFPEVYEECQQVALLRMRLLPYIYSAFAKYYLEGIPPFLSLHLLPGFQSDEEIKSAYMMGESILVAPMFAGEQRRKVKLPNANWYDFYTGKFVGNNETTTVSPGLDKIPLFVKDGGIIPLAPPMYNTSEIKKDIPLEVRHYGKSAGTFLLYDDDGETFDYEKGIFSLRELRVFVDDKGKLVGRISELKSGLPWSYGEVGWRFMGE